MMLSEALAGVLFDAALKSLNPAPASDGFILSLPAQLSPAKLAPRSALEQAFCRCLPVRLSGGFFSLLRPSGFLPHCHCCARDGQWLGECSVLSEHLRRLTASA